MNIKKVLAVMVSFAVVFSLAACQKGKQENTDVQTTAAATEADITLVGESDITEITSTQDDATGLHDQTSGSSSEPETWSAEQIVEFYKAAALKTHPNIKSQHRIDLKSISVNDGQYEGLFDFITSVMSKLLANNSEDKDGITGGYNNLTAVDIKSARAYKVGNNTVVELVMNQQVSGASDDALSGSVGHAITAVGDIGVVTKQIADLGIPLEIGDENTKIYYTNPTVKVLVSPEGKILNGTWRYTVEIRLSNYRAFGKPVEKNHNSYG